ncbi:14614_t:CDS:1, partial [Cetraspora pellucida]
EKNANNRIEVEKTDKNSSTNRQNDFGPCQEMEIEDLPELNKEPSGIVVEKDEHELCDNHLQLHKFSSS